jgi:hypothetical protein
MPAHHLALQPFSVGKLLLSFTVPLHNGVCHNGQQRRDDKNDDDVHGCSPQSSRWPQSQQKLSDNSNREHPHFWQ